MTARRGRPPLPPELRKPRKSGPSGKGGGHRAPDAAELAAQRAAILALLPAGDVVVGVDGPEPRHGALTALSRHLGITPARVRAAWAGRVRIGPDTLARWAAAVGP